MSSRRRKRQQPPAVALDGGIEGSLPTPVASAPQPEPTGHQAMLGKLLPELTLVVTLGALLLIPTRVPWLNANALEFAIAADVAMTLMSATLVDVASRLRRVPPWWLAILVAGGILVLYPGAGSMIFAAWQQGLWIFLPFAWSLVERLRELWTLPAATALEKIRRRTLTFDRVYTALALGGISVAGLVINDVLHDGNVAMGSHAWFLPVLGLTYFGVAAFNAWRVHQAAFALRPRSLWPWVDDGQATDLSPL